MLLFLWQKRCNVLKRWLKAGVIRNMSTTAKLGNRF